MATKKEPSLAEEAGLPDSWVPIDSRPINPSAPPTGPNKMGPYYSGSISPTMQHDAVFVGTKYGSPNIPVLPLMPVSQSGRPTSVSAITSVTSNVNSVTNIIGGWVWKGVWSITSSYKINDVVSYNGYTYLAIQTSIGAQPDISSTQWQPIGIAFGVTTANLVFAGPNTGGPALPSFRTLVEADTTLTDITTNNVTSVKHGYAPKSPADATKFLNGAATPAFALVKDSDLSVSDITTNNVTSAAHGFTPKSPADATKFLNGAATPVFAMVMDSYISITNITTNNVSITKHGFAPILPNDATKYLDGTGAYSVPSSGGSGVTSVALSAPSIFTVSGSPVTTTGTLTFVLNTQTANLVFAGPNTGSPATPTFRALVALDIPNLDAGKITTGTLALARGGTNADLSASGSSTAVLAQDASHVITARNLIAADIPNIAESQVTSLVSDLALKAPLASPTFTGVPAGPTAAPATNTTQLATTAFVTAAIGASGGGTVTSVDVTVPTELSITGNPVTTAGTLAFTWNSASGNKVIASPAGGGSGAYVGRALVALDIPNLDAGKITTGTLALARGGTNADLSASGGTTAVLAQDASHVITARNLIAADIPNIAESQVTSLVSDLALKAPLASPALTGSPTAPTQTSTDNSTKIATDAFVKAAIPGGVGFPLDGGGSVISTGVKSYIQIPYAGTIIGWSIIADQSGSITVEIDKVASSAPPSAPVKPNTTTDKISSSAPVSLSSAATAAVAASGVSTWTTAVAAWDVFGINVTAATTLTRATIILNILRS